MVGGKSVFRAATEDDIPAMVDVVYERMSCEMNWDKYKVTECLRQYIAAGEADLDIKDGRIRIVWLG